MLVGRRKKYDKENTLSASFFLRFVPLAWLRVVLIVLFPLWGAGRERKLAENERQHEMIQNEVASYAY